MAGGINFSALDISASGMMAERMRMEVVSSNIANAQSTRGSDGEPYRRQQVVFASAMQDLAGRPNLSSSVGGVQIVDVQGDQSAFPSVFNPGHPDADEKGMVIMPNVKLPNEMVDLISASRSYEANLRAVKSFRQMAEQTLSLLRGSN